MPKTSSILSAIVLTFGLIPSTSALSAPLKNSQTIKGLVTRCEYADGLTIRVLAPRKCPTITTPEPAPPVVSAIQSAAAPSVTARPVAQAQGSATKVADGIVAVPQNGAKTNEDPILEKSINRCIGIGFKKDTVEFRNCVVEQITLISKQP